MNTLIIIALISYGIWTTISCFDFIEDIKVLRKRNKQLKFELAQTKVKCNHKRIKSIVLNSAVTLEEKGIHCFDCNTTLKKEIEN